MSIKVAVASSDGKVINRHFGQAAQFLVFQIQGSNIEFLELRENIPPCQEPEYHENRLSDTVELLSDCQAVLVSRIGPGAARALEAGGIKAYVAPDYIEAVLRRLIITGELKQQDD
ncbi:MAG: dinitrogenase iron-molybdenum cofactor biosynthesis protein [Firmicutes bacterium]|nr:dinitrogenase iron-molybdenum cofactor biosynthesis protein [Bacillota bacterium]